MGEARRKKLSATTKSIWTLGLSDIAKAEQVAAQLHAAEDFVTTNINRAAELERYMERKFIMIMHREDWKKEWEERKAKESK